MLSNVLDSVDGEEWDSFTIAVSVPAGDSMLEVQVFTGDPNVPGYLDRGNHQAHRDGSLLKAPAVERLQSKPRGVQQRK